MNGLFVVRRNCSVSNMLQTVMQYIATRKYVKIFFKMHKTASVSRNLCWIPSSFCNSWLHFLSHYVWIGCEYETGPKGGELKWLIYTSSLSTFHVLDNKGNIDRKKALKPQSALCHIPKTVSQESQESQESQVSQMSQMSQVSQESQVTQVSQVSQVKFVYSILEVSFYSEF
jgi:hypothetical protein